MNTTLLYSLLGVLELVFVVSGLAVWLWLRNRRAGARIAELEGLIVAFLNLDRVIDIIRYDDDPKAALMREDWGRTPRVPRPGRPSP